MIKHWGLRFGTAMVAVLALLPAEAAGAADPAPLVTDLAGDANFLGLYHVPGGQVRAIFGDQLDSDPFNGGVSTAPASYGPGDLTSVRYETPYVAVPVGDDGVDYRATGLRVHLRTAEQPRSPAGTSNYTVYVWLIDEFETMCRSSLSVALGEGQGAGTYPVVWRFETQFDSLCPRPGGGYTSPEWLATVGPMGITMNIPASGLLEEERFVIAEGAVMRKTLGITSVSAAQLDRTPFGADWKVGQDMPADVPCTTGCP